VKNQEDAVVTRHVVAAVLGTLLLGTCAVLAANAPPKESVHLRLLSETEYRNSIADILGPSVQIQGRFQPGRRVGGLVAASSSVLSVTASGFEGYAKMADGIAVQVVGPKNRAQLVGCTPKTPSAADDACATQFIARYGRMLFRRPLTSDEIKSRVQMADKLAVTAKDFYAGLRYTLAVTMLSSPEFLFRNERAIPTADGKSYTLDAYSRAARLSYLMWDTTPDEELLRVAENGELNTSAGVQKQVDRLMASPRLETGMRAFFADMLQLDTFDNTVKDTLIYQKYNDQFANSATEETLRTIIDLTLRRNEDVRDLMTTRKTFINRTLAAIYDVPFTFDGDWMPYEFPKDSERSGVMTQASMLSMFSHPGRSSPTKRGVALMDIFLCQPTPSPPANVDFSIVNNTSGPLKTVRDRLTAHATNPICASCHTHSDPIGMSLEHFDSVGSKRLTENGAVIDVSGKMNRKDFIGADGLGQIMHDDPKITACLVRKVYAYGVGGNSETIKKAEYQDANQAFTDNGYKLRPLLHAVAISPVFYAVPAPVPAPAATKTAMQ
jgi:hypothetical protein